MAFRVGFVDCFCDFALVQWSIGFCIVSPRIWSIIILDSSVKPVQVITATLYINARHCNPAILGIT